MGMEDFEKKVLSQPGASERVKEIEEELRLVAEANRVGFRKDLDALFEDQKMIGEDFRIALRKILNEHFPGRFFQA